MPASAPRPGSRKASVVTMTMFDIRSGVQIAISEGKATVAAFMDADNAMVVSLRSYRAQEIEGGLGRGGALKGGQ